ncbi:hypothetical protein [Streptomyces sp. NPDC005209]|uniref:hypothetical protein n=1 Tax=Streptomyces sp. NPDC005209 TaxID=3156715 RepID=UPI0033A8B6A4
MTPAVPDYPEPEPDWTDSPDLPSLNPDDITEPCAFAGDPLCPDNPVVVPPPDLGTW